MKDLITKFKGEADKSLLPIAVEYMGDEKKAKAFVQSVKDMYISNPSLQKVDDLSSIFSAAKKVAQLGLTIGGDMDIIPRGGKVFAEPNYKGFVTLALRAGMFAKANVVFEKDEFDLDIGSSFVKHKPFLGKGGRGEPIGFYACVTLKDGATVIDWIGVDELNEFKKKNNLSSPAWQNSFNEMGKKTILKRVLKVYMYADPSSGLSELINTDNAIEVEQSEQKNQSRFDDLPKTKEEYVTKKEVKIDKETGEVSDDFDPERDVLI